MKETHKITNQFKTTLTTLCYNSNINTGVERTTSLKDTYSLQTPIYTNFQDDNIPEKQISNTYETLRLLRTIETRLTLLNLYDNSYLHLRNGIFYFSVRVSSLVIRISLHTDNLTLAIVLKLKIFHHLNLNNINPTTYYTYINTDKLALVKDFEIEKLLERVSKRIIRAIALQSDKVEIADKKVPTVRTATLKDYTHEFISDKERLSMSSKTLIKYKQAIEYLHIYYGANCKVHEIDYKAALGFSRFLQLRTDGLYSC